MTAHIAVIGAGPAGLAAAWQACTAGHQVTVLEQAPAVGGMAGSFDVAGLRVDHGSHRLHPATPPRLLGALEALLGDDLQVRTRNGRIRLLDRWVAFPLRTGDLLRNMPPGFAARAVRDAALGPLRHPRDDSYAEVVRAGLGPAVLDAFYGPYAHKLWGCAPDELAGELARRRISASSPLAILRRLVRGARPEGRTFLYPRRGFGQISEAVADAARRAGADIRLGQGVAQLQPADGGWSVKLTDGDTLTADHAWSTMPAGGLARLIPTAPEPVLRAAGSLESRAMVLLYLVLDRPQWTPFDAHYFPGPETCASRVSEPRNYRESTGDPADVTVLCAEIPCSRGDRTWRATDRELASLLSEELGAMGLPAARPIEVTTHRLPRVYPIYRPGYEQHLAVLESWVDDLPNLITFGRQGLFTPDNTHHALEMGWSAAESLGPDGTFDHQGWTAARTHFRSFVVED